MPTQTPNVHSYLQHMQAEFVLTQHQMPNLVPVGALENAQFQCRGYTGPTE